MLQKVIARVQSDCFTPDRLKLYAELLDVALKAGYIVTSLEHYYRKNGDRNSQKWMILRHDIDTGSNNANLFFDLEKKNGVTSTFYFRRSTLPSAKVLQAIVNYGSAVGYHYEEAATYAKLFGIPTKEELLSKRAIILRKLFRNLESIRKYSGVPIRSIAAHGDFINRVLGVSNKDFIARNVYHFFDVDFEAYDLVEEFDLYVSDDAYPQLWKNGTSAMDAILQRVPRIYFTSHPKHWFPDVRGNMRHTLRTIIEYALWRFRKTRRGLKDLSHRRI